MLINSKPKQHRDSSIEYLMKRGNREGSDEIMFDGKNIYIKTHCDWWPLLEEEEQKKDVISLWTKRTMIAPPTPGTPPIPGIPPSLSP